jgi:hypothetical protein
MRDLIILFVHVIFAICRLWRPGGNRSLIAESILLKQQPLILNRSRKRAPNLRASNRFIAGVCSMFMKSSRLIRSAIVLKPSMAPFICITSGRNITAGNNSVFRTAFQSFAFRQILQGEWVWFSQ